MHATHDEGLINQHLQKIRVHAEKIPYDDKVASAIQETINQACDHFLLARDSDPQANLLAFKGRLKLLAVLAHESDADRKKALAYAASLAAGR